MSIVVVGLNHRTSPVDLLERLSIATADLPKALHQLLGYQDITEGVVISTCNRTEVYAAVKRFHGGAQDLRNFLAEFCHVAPEEFSDRLYTYHDVAAVRHLFRVASGVDSMVVGESEILGQVKSSFAVASNEDAVGRVLDPLFRHALRVGKRVRTETAIGRNAVSVSSAAVELARRSLASEAAALTGARTLLVGAGEVARLAARALRSAGAGELEIVSRTPERAETLARDLGGSAVALSQLEGALARADVVVSSTSSVDPVITRQMVERVMPHRSGRPLLLLDIAVPRDIEAEVRGIPGVSLKDIDDLKGLVRDNLDGRLAELPVIERIVDDGIERLQQTYRSAAAGPGIEELLAETERIRASELAKLGPLGDDVRMLVDEATRRIVAKIVHGPIEDLKRAASASSDVGPLDDAGTF